MSTTTDALPVQTATVTDAGSRRTPTFGAPGQIAGLFVLSPLALAATLALHGALGVFALATATGLLLTLVASLVALMFRVLDDEDGEALG